MYEVNICNFRNNACYYNEYDVMCDRSNILGNPFVMHNESERDKVCDLYIDYFNKRVKNDQNFRNKLDYMIKLLKKHKKLNLWCWCAPKRCHTETIRKYLLDNVEVESD